MARFHDTTRVIHHCSSPIHISVLCLAGAAASAAQTKTANAVKAEKKDDGMLSSVERKKKKELQLAKTTNKPPPAKAKGEKMNIFDEKRTRNKASAASLGVVRLDYEYPPAPGDIDSPDSCAPRPEPADRARRSALVTAGR
jgi:hypothetical protein